MKKKLLAVVMSMVFVTGMLAGCGSSTKETSTKDTKSTETESKDSYTIGISQFAEHGSLDNCREGFLEGLKELRQCTGRYRNSRNHCRQLCVKESRSDLRDRNTKCHECL